VAVRSGNGGGKTALAAIIVHHGIQCYDDSKIPTTAGSWLQLTEYLWPEIHKWVPRLRWDIIGLDPYLPKRELQTLSLRMLPNRRAFAAGCDNPDFIEGAHAGWMSLEQEDPSTQRGLIGYVFDEAKAVPSSIWNAAEGAFSGAGERGGQDAFAFAISTPRSTTGEFWRIHARKPGYENWHPLHWTVDQLLASGMITQDWVNMMHRKLGETDPIYRNRVLGEFAQYEEDTLVPLDWVEAAQERGRIWASSGRKLNGHRPIIGGDVGRGGDKSVICQRYGNIVPPLTKMDLRDTMRVAGQIAALLNDEAVANVDVIGLGAGVVDRLKEQGHHVVGVNFGASSHATDRSGELGFLNMRAYCYWSVRDFLDPELYTKEDGTIDDERAPVLPDDENLLQDLTSIKWSLTSGGKIKMEPKEKLRSRLGRSPDEGDSLALTFSPPLQVFI